LLIYGLGTVDAEAAKAFFYGFANMLTYQGVKTTASDSIETTV
jgi:hypothetical protein